jgi:autotransporter-associated beta strand protein
MSLINLHKSCPGLSISKKSLSKKWLIFSNFVLGGLISSFCFAAEKQEFIYVDPRVHDYHQLINELPDSIEIVILDSQRNGIEQIAEHLEKHNRIDAIHLVSHGQEGKIQAGNMWLSADNIADNKTHLASIGSALGESGDILIYGCNVAFGSDGAAFVQQLADITGADVAASTNVTGAAAKGGDWELEKQVGEILADIAFTEGARISYASLLQTVAGTIDFHVVNPPPMGLTIGSIVTDGDAGSADIPNVTYQIFGTDAAGVANGSIWRYEDDMSGDEHDGIWSDADYGDPVVVIRSENEAEFSFQGIDFFDYLGAQPQVRIEGFRDGVSTGFVVLDLASYAGDLHVASFGIADLPSSTFGNVDEIRLTNPNEIDPMYGPPPGTKTMLLALDDIVFGELVIPNTAPVIANLNTDSVAWPGVGNTVTLDNGGNASLTDTELGALNSGNGNWSGASLTVQRSTAVAADTLGFNTSGALFAVSGGNLQVTGQTFATFTNTGGVLTISFTNATATTALVNDVARHISYRNDTPAGDASIRFTLNDGNVDGAVANVTVSSDSIYVTNTTDTAAINPVGGVSFSEAIAIAAADATGSQTIVIDGSLAGQTVSTSAATSLGESLTLDLGLASGVTLSGGTLSIGSTFILTATNDAADTATISTMLSGAGGLTKTGAGSVTLSGTNTYTGATSVSAGTLAVSGGDAISSNSSVTVASGATLALSNNETIGSLSGAGAVTLGSNTLTSIITADTIFSGGIGGAGGLSVSQSGAATFALTLSGTNTYTGNTTAVNYGWLKLNGDASVSSSSQLRANGNSIITLQSDQTIGSLSSNNANASIQLDAFTLSAGGDSTSTTVYGVISGSGNLVKQGSGTLTLEGTNTYNGTTTVSAGTLSVTSDSNLGSGAVNLAVDTVLQVTGAANIDNAVVLSGNATIDTSSNATLSGSLSGSFGLSKTGLGTLSLSGSNSHAGTTVTGGGLAVASDGNLGSGDVILAEGTTLITIGGTIISKAITLAGNATVSNSFDAVLSGVISGAGALTKAGAATLTLTGTNTATGSTTVAAGGLTLQGGASISDSGAVTVASGSTLTLALGTETIGSLAGSGNVVLNYRLTTGGDNSSTTFSGVISGSGSGITKTGSGTFTLSGTNTYTGSTSVSAGTLLLNGGAAIADSSAVTVASGATLSLGASETLASLAGAGNVSVSGFTLTAGGNNTSTTFSGALGGSGDLIKAGSGTFTLSGSISSNFSGGTTVSGGGTLSVASDDNLGSGTLTINASNLAITGSTNIDNNIVLVSSATVNSTAAATLSGVISGSGSLTKTGNSALTLSGTNTYGGATTVSAGPLVVAGALNGTTSVSVVSGATIMGSGSVTNLLVNSGGILSPGNSLGIFTVNGNLQMDSGSTLAVEINGTTAGTDYDQVIVSGTVGIAGNLAATHGYTAGQGDSYTIIVNDMADAITGTFSGLAEGATTTAGGNNTVLTASYIGGTGNDFTLTAPINSAPVIANLNGDNVTFIEDSALVLLDANNDATVTDSDSVDFAGGNVTVAIVANQVNTEDVLSIQNQGTAGGQIGTSGLNITYEGTIIGTRTAIGGTDNNDLVIALNSSATPAIVQALVRNLTYINTNTTTPTTTARTVRVTANDGNGGTSTDANISVAVTEVNDAPTLTATGSTPTFTEGGAAVNLFSPTVIDTVEAGQSIQTLVITITNVTNGNSEVIAVNGSNVPLTNGFNATTVGDAMDASVVVAGSTATLTLTKAAGIAVAAAQTLLDGITYSNSSISPGVANRVVAITSIQDTGGVADGGVDTTNPNVSATISISAVNSEPVVTTTGGATAFIEGNAVSIPVVIDSGITVSDLDNTTLASATVSITSNFQSAEDVLAFTHDSTTMGNISAGYDAATGVLTLTSSGATATLAEWQSALASVTYTNSSRTPNTATRQLSFVINDGVVASAAGTKDVSVTAVNNTPIISGSPLLSISQNVAYHFVPGVTDVDSTVFVFSIANKPTWAVFDGSTGALTGTPTHADIGVTTGIVISVSDGITSTSLPAFNLTVVNTNDAPLISGTPVTRVDQGVAYSFTPVASDSNSGDVLTFSIVNKPTWATFNTATGALTGTPTRADIGATAGITISVSDGNLSASLPPFTLTVAGTNRAPVISGSPVLEITAGSSYSFTPTASDTDEDSLTFSIVNRPAWASFDVATGTLIGVPTEGDVGSYGGIIISVSDGAASVSLPVFTIVVATAVDPLAPVVTAPDERWLDAVGLYTPVSLRQLLGLSPAASEEEIDQALAAVATDSESGNDCCNALPEGLNAANLLLLPPGRHEIVWKTTNAAGLTGMDIQIVNLRPLVSFSKDQIAVRDSEVQVRVILNGPSPVYPLDIPYEIDTASTALPDEHSLNTALASFTEPGQTEVVIPVILPEVIGAGDSELILRLDDQSPAGAPPTADLFDINAGAANRHTIRIRTGNVPPTVDLQLSQGGVNTSLITPIGGLVTATAMVVDPNSADSHSFDWSASDSSLNDTDGDVTNATWVFDPVGLAGRQRLEVTVSDSAGANAVTQMYFRVVNTLPVLNAETDSDGDGVDDVTEGFGDSNGNGIPDYLDNRPSGNVLPQTIAVTGAYLLECEPGVLCRIGRFALMSETGGVQLLDRDIEMQPDLIADETHTPVGGIFDFDINGLPTPGQSVRIVIPQQVAVPANAVYRKFQQGAWTSFVENGSNALHSAVGNPGYCPPPASADWQSGLIAGHLCVQLTIEDGGPNDADGLVNAAISDPGAVSTAKANPPVEPPKPAPTPTPTPAKSSGGGAFGGIWLLVLSGLWLLRRSSRKRSRA